MYLNGGRNPKMLKYWRWFTTNFSWLNNVNFNLYSIMDTIKWVIGALSPSIKQLEREAYHSLLFSAKVKHSWSCTSMYSRIFTVRCSVKHRDKYTFSFHSPLESMLCFQCPLLLFGIEDVLKSLTNLWQQWQNEMSTQLDQSLVNGKQGH